MPEIMSSATMADGLSMSRASAGVRSADRDGRGLGVVIADLDSDGRSDIYVANDMTANFLFHNQGDFRFEEVGESAGVASSGEGGVSVRGWESRAAISNGDGRPELAVTNFYGESTSLSRQLGRRTFRRPHGGLPDWPPQPPYVLGFGTFIP